MDRKKVENKLYEILDELTGTKDNSDMYRTIFSKMNARQFKKWYDDILSEDDRVVIIIPNYSKITLRVGRLQKLADKLGVPFYQRVVTGEQGDIPPNMSPVKHLVLYTPYRRAAQRLTDKIRTAKDNETKDTLTKTVTGKSKVVSLSAPSIRILDDLGLKNTLEELIDVRAGNEGKQRAMTAQIQQTGGTSLADIEKYSTNVETNELFKIYMLGQHLQVDIS